MSISTLKWPELATIAPLFIRRSARRRHVLVAGHGDEDVAVAGGVGHRHHVVAVHRGLERAQRVDLGHDHVRAMPLGRAARHRGRTSRSPRPRSRARDQQVRGADDAVDRGLARAVAVVEEVLGVGVVDRDDRVAQLACRASARRRMTPVVVSSVPPITSASRSVRSLWSTATTSAPSSIVTCGCLSKTRDDVLVVGLVVLALDRVGLGAVTVDQRGGDVVLGGRGFDAQSATSARPPSACA